MSSYQVAIDPFGSKLTLRIQTLFEFEIRILPLATMDKELGMASIERQGQRT